MVREESGELSQLVQSRLVSSVLGTPASPDHTVQCSLDRRQCCNRQRISPPCPACADRWRRCTPRIGLYRPKGTQYAAQLLSSWLYGSVIDAAAFEAIHSDINLPPLLCSRSPCIAPAVNPVGRAEDGESSVHHLS